EQHFQSVKQSLLLYEHFVDESEETNLLQEIETHLKRVRYESTHWDDAILNYRETEIWRWNQQNKQIIERIRKLAFSKEVKSIDFVHVLDLAENGVIKPHIDSVRFCGRIIAGLSLLSPSIMRLVHENNKNFVIDVLLKRRSLYIMKDSIRYDFTHQILGNDESFFNGVKVPKTRRISLICRCEPQ
ncbi:alpha-ketoglutarate-dependent dioxygenase alkB 7-like protein, partial [Dinothrombium tinctorium]